MMHTEQVTIDIFLPTLEIKDYDIMVDGKNVFDQPVKNSLRTYENRKIATGQGDDYTTVCLSLFQEHYKMITIDYN